MAGEQKFGRRWQEYRASKATLFWSCAACVVLTMIVGFTWGGWVTGGTANEMAENAAQNSRAELAATVCVERFLDASDARAQLASLKETGSWQRDDFVEKGGWTSLPGVEEPVTDAAGLCAEKLAAIELPPENEATNEDSATTIVQ